MSNKKTITVPSWNGPIPIEVTDHDANVVVKDADLFADEIALVLAGGSIDKGSPHYHRIMELVKQQKAQNSTTKDTAPKLQYEQITVHVPEAMQLLRKKKLTHATTGKKFIVFGLEGFLHSSYWLWNKAYRTKNPIFYQMLLNIEDDIEHHTKIIQGVGEVLIPHIEKAKKSFGGNFNRYTSKHPRTAAFNPISPHGRLGVELVRTFDTMLRDLFQLMHMNEINKKTYDDFAVGGRNKIGASFIHYCNKINYMNRAPVIGISAKDYVSANPDKVAIVVAAREKLGDVSNDVLNGTRTPINLSPLRNIANTAAKAPVTTPAKVTTPANNAAATAADNMTEAPTKIPPVESTSPENVV